ncbi:DUF1990 domain-containing protein [Corynebacterium bovis]|uniref:DUF1990 domain-containing protein n=1 Tax=Corynebacterium bovis TaxID=36808 RepID=UPI00254D2BB0|nr:DUF1990 domain-containing protein [Corynebacterium bovis]MDK8510110.1 DUF1990 domain-containing protein [Corynebacterium bovis]
MTGVTGDPGNPGIPGDPRLTYPADLVGRSLAGALAAPDAPPPDRPGFTRVHATAVLGHGRDVLLRAADRVLGGEVHRAAGAPLWTADARPVAGGGRPVAVGDVVTVHFLGTRSPCLVLDVRSPADATGTAGTSGTAGTWFSMTYGTLPGHQECGEETFAARLLPDGTVTGTVTAVSRPATWLTRLGGPAARAVQRRMAARYVRAMR